MKKTSSLLNLVAGLSCVAGGFVSFTAFTAFAAPNFVAHEWGTFTSVQGADGVQMAWNPLSVADLPSFVHDWPRSGPPLDQRSRVQLVSKATTMTIQRMETPVIYFYADGELSVNVAVKFPLGTMTEWYPQVNLPAKPSRAEVFGPNELRWDNVLIMPGDTKLGSVSCAAKVDGLPMTQEASHYYAARETDADRIRVNGETEKFLFYRGVGNFRAPLTVTLSGLGGESMSLKNTGGEPLPRLFVYHVEGSEARFVSAPGVEPGAQADLRLDSIGTFEPVSAVRTRLGMAMTDALVEAGLYAAEARAMVKTWDDSWFGEQGLRVLYLLPGAWTDRVLPLTLEPKAAQVTRVMVGRAEMITPKMESDVGREIVRYGGGDDVVKAEAIASVRALGLGRFLEPAVRRVMAGNPQFKALALASASLLQAASKPPVKPGRLAAK